MVKGHASAAPIFPISTYFLAPVHKLSVYDMVYDEYNNRLNLLGMFNYCSLPTTLIAQANPFNLSYLNMGQIASMYGNVTCTTWDIPIQTVIGNDVRLNNITLNPFNPCSTTVSTGIAKNSFGNTPYLTETFDIQQSNCDMTFKVLTSPCTPNTYPVQTQFQQPPTFSPSLTNPTTILTTSYFNECPDAIVCAKSSAILDSLTPKLISQNNSISVSITYYNNFVCQGFTDIITYEIINADGRIVASGKTQNHISNHIDIARSGIYFIRCSDNFGNNHISKFVIVF
ncbi:MAG: T9SS type A sorting domain-containing protein [Bacteroidales bacterium]|nr:T9SS type A sorting domain-containing protein [Bacteroidales bacterium]